jgi:hypothetical protein
MPRGTAGVGQTAGTARLTDPETGAGPGRFTIEPVALDAAVVVSDVSAVQLELNEAKVRAAGREAAVERV